MAGRAALPKVGFMAGCAALLEDRVQGGSHLNMSGLKRVVAIEDLEMERLRCVEVVALSHPKLLQCLMQH